MHEFRLRSLDFFTRNRGELRAWGWVALGLLLFIPAIWVALNQSGQTLSDPAGPSAVDADDDVVNIIDKVETSTSLVVAPSGLDRDDGDVPAVAADVSLRSTTVPSAEPPASVRPTVRTPTPAAEASVLPRSVTPEDPPVPAASTITAPSTTQTLRSSVAPKPTVPDTPATTEPEKPNPPTSDAPPTDPQRTSPPDNSKDDEIDS